MSFINNDSRPPDAAEIKEIQSVKLDLQTKLNLKQH